MARLTDDIAEYLAAQGIGTVGTDIFVDHLPDLPDSCVAVMQTGGQQPSIYLPTKRPTFQVIVRNATHPGGEDRLASVRGLLHNLYNTPLNSGQTYAYYVQASSEGGFIGKDAAGRYEFSANFQCLTR